MSLLVNYIHLGKNVSEPKKKLENLFTWIFSRPNQKPAIKWGQRKDHVFLTIAVQDIHHPEIQIDQNRLCFK